MRTTSFTYFVGDDCRVRHLHHRRRGIVLSFVVQLEVHHPRRDVWLPVVRYDTAHGFAHRDRLHPDGRIEKTPLPIDDYAQALNYAEADIQEHWESYRHRFLEEWGHED